VTRTVAKIIEPPAGYELASQPPAKTLAASPNAASDPAAKAAFASTKVERAVQPKPEVTMKKLKDRNSKAQPAPAKAKPSDGKPSAKSTIAPTLADQL
jgi:hypothetical protein